MGFGHNRDGGAIQVGEHIDRHLESQVRTEKGDQYGADQHEKSILQ
jgi:hypothetical protein